MKPNPSSAACHGESQTRETGAGEKESGLSKCQDLRRPRIRALKAHLNLSAQTGVFLRGGGEAEQRDQGRGCGPAGSVLAGPNVDL